VEAFRERTEWGLENNLGGHRKSKDENHCEIAHYWLKNSCLWGTIESRTPYAHHLS